MNKLNKAALPIAVAAAGFIGVSGASLLSTLSANAASTTATTSTSSSQPAMPAHGIAAHEDTETAVTGDNATKAQAAAVKSVGSGTAGDVTSDFNKSGYETTVTKSDGTKVEVHLDSSFNVMQGGPGGGHRPNDNDTDDSGTSSSSSSTSTTN